LLRDKNISSEEKQCGVCIHEQKICFVFIFKCRFFVEIPKYVLFSDSNATFTQAMQEGRKERRQATNSLPAN
jgi:hypothetical protein